ncbi:hypothetical protein CVD28_04580 [Bacillus sp. M6-12]|uniref:site-specific DNA-methyltransferase n=1 Tax=Bacillus sp. M6-12 TaxID=2054166 RepID=UPI000C76C3FC|nr:site-specific DNA-methyltransferase [Bacillus sp. M6-12]PLS19693.1 hypothetical protein CVD28_04580 [Bacillus sp. M6-12]
MRYRASEIPEHLLNFFERSGESVSVHNNHPTVKPLDLMRELVKLVTPQNGVCLEPFAGSGTTLVACQLEDIDFVGIEQEEEYVKISNRRVSSIKTKR